MRRTERWLCAVCVSTAIAVARPHGNQTNRPDVSEKALVAAAARYVADYEKQFAFLVADEEYEQLRFDDSNRLAQRRTLKSEVFLTYLPADMEWIAVRDVISVDGQLVEHRDDLRQLLAKSETLRGLIGRLVTINARYNIGSVERNFNEPTLPLLLLEPKRIRTMGFDRGRVTRDGPTTLATLTYEERGVPLVGGLLGGVPAKGEFVVDAATGTIRRTTFALKRFDLKVSLETDYTRDDKLSLWLPSVFREYYERTGVRERITCEARYSNYRRFDVTGRIK